MEQIFRDFQIAIRSLRKAPAFTLAAVLTLALGIGANSTIFSVANNVLLRPLQYRNPDRLAIIWNDYGSGGQSLPAVSAPDFRDYQLKATQNFEGFAATTYASLELTTPSGRSQQVDVGVVTSNFFSLLGVQPQLGRAFTSDETVPNGPHVAMLTHRIWQQQFGARADIVGQAINIGRVPTTIVGILPASFELELPPEKFLVEDSDIYTPLQIQVDKVPRNLTGMTVLARLKRTASWAQAQAEMDGVAAELRREFAVHQMSGLRIRAVPLQQDVVKHAKLPLLVLLVAVAFVLLIACGNVANLLLARAVSRKREMAVRSALGATGYRLARQVLIESLVVSVLGGVAGIFVAELGVRLLIALHPASLPRLDEIAVNGWALAYTAGLSLCTALLFGLAPALQAARPDLRDALAEGTRSSQRLTKSKVAIGLILGQVALSVVLMIGCSLLLRSFARLQHIRPGFEPENVLTFRVSLPAAVYPDQNAFRTTFRRLREQLRATPGVLSVGETVKIPLTGSGPQTPYAWNDETLQRWESISADWRSVSPDYFNAMGIRFEAGRAFTDDDDEQHPGVVIIDDLLAKRVWPDQNPIGKRLTINDKAEPKDWLTVVGVVHHVRAHDITTNLREQIYLPYFQQPTRIMVFTLKTAGDPAALVPSVTQAVHSVDPNLAVYQVHSMQEYFRLAMAQARFVLILSGVFGGVALLLTAIGIYGLISYFTSKRVREFGIRVALGAQRADIYRMVMSEGFRLAATGVVIGLAFAFFTGGMLRSLLYGISANDAVSFLSVPLILLAVALLAAFLPARQAMQVDAATALRSE
jgi:predicted permease